MSEFLLLLALQRKFALIKGAGESIGGINVRSYLAISSPQFPLPNMQKNGQTGNLPECELSSSSSSSARDTPKDCKTTPNWFVIHEKKRPTWIFVCLVDIFHPTPPPFVRSYGNSGDSSSLGDGGRVLKIIPRLGSMVAS